MGVYKRPGTAVYWCRFQINGHEIRRSTRTTDRRAAEIEERRLRSYHEGQAPRRRASRQLSLADIGSKDVARAAAAGSTEEHQAALESQWVKIVQHFGADSPPTVITHDSVIDYVAARRQAGALGQTISREVSALKRGCAIAHRKGAMPVVPQTWPRIRRDASSKRKGRLHPPAVLLRWFAELPHDARDEAKLAALTGLRAAELKRLTTQWVEPAPPELVALGVPAIARVPAECAKARRERVLPLVPEALEIIRRRAHHAAELGEPPGPLLHQGSHKTAHRLARKRIGYTTPISLRDLRHTFGTLANRLVGIDAARDGLGHASIATTNHYVSGDMGRLASATLAIAGLVGTAKPAQAGEGLKMERATGFEPATLSLGSYAKDLADILDHVSACRHCQQAARAHGNVRLIAHDVGTGKSAQGRA